MLVKEHHKPLKLKKLILSQEEKKSGEEKRREKEAMTSDKPETRLSTLH